MSRVDRLAELAALLRGRESTTVPLLAEELAVSERTVLRDLATLRDQGQPIVTESGHGGGVRLERDRGIVAVHFSIDELIALWMAATLSARATSLPWSAAAKRALDKVLASLPRPRARLLQAVSKRVVVGRPASPRVYAELGQASPLLLAAVERCFTASLCVAFEYVDRHGAATERTVEPHGLLVETPAFYLLARDLEKRAVRIFRLDRIRRARVLEDRPFTADLDSVHVELLAQRAAPPFAGA